MSLLQILRWLLLLGEVWTAVPIMYLCILTTAAISETPKRKRENIHSFSTYEASKVNFAILIPAHNEEVLLPGLIDSLAALVYPKDKYTVYVVADNCTDKTARLARETGWVQVFERFDDANRSKGHAIRWLMQRLEEKRLVHDAYIIMDADAIVDRNFLQAMARELAQGARVLQGDSTVTNAYESPSTVMRLIATSLFYHIRAIGRNAIGGSSTLNGNGMCFSRAILERYPWQAYSLSEDYEYYLNLVQHGECVRYVPDAIVSTYMPTSFKQMRTQDIRWESPVGDGSSLWQIARQLVGTGIRDRNFVSIEAVFELLTPPLSFLAGSFFLLFIASLLLQSPAALLISLLLLVGLSYYVGTGIYFLRLPKKAYKVFLYMPGFILWKLWVILVLTRSKKHINQWVRSSRPTT
ncbi:MAG TPA: glycosyltransferase family 2 protein [Ktedonobacteraceae bacterium]|nr:glycosyltransferase family 2 protein [Ktedonobacteraceae bacterium]